MNEQQPHYRLFSQFQQPDESAVGVWRFTLEAVDGSTRFEASDREPNVTGDRLALLSVIRGLEALDQPSRVSLRTTSRYVARGFRFGLPAWRENNWCWESFGAMRLVDNDDLWRKVDQILKYHRVRCRGWQPIRNLRIEARSDAFQSRAVSATTPSDQRANRLKTMAHWAEIFQPHRPRVACA